MSNSRKQRQAILRAIAPASHICGNRFAKAEPRQEASGPDQSRGIRAWRADDVKPDKQSFHR